MELIRPALYEYRTWAADSRRWDPYRPRPGDIIIATYPKSGTTWMQQIVSSLVFQDATSRSLDNLSPWIDARHLGRSEAEIYQVLEAQTHRRFPKTHLPVDALPLFDDVRYIHVARDGRDAVISMHDYFSGFTNAQLENLDRIGLADPAIAAPFPRVPADPAVYFRRWVSSTADAVTHRSFFDFEVGYWAERRRSNFLLVHYNDLLGDLESEMRRIARFLAIEVKETVWPSLVRAATFAEMQAAGDVLTPTLVNRFVGGTRRMFNKGTNRRWDGILTDDDLALYDARLREKFSPGLAQWIAGGRGAAGDPRAAAG
jgi:aryl sulfotransferase